MKVGCLALLISLSNLNQVKSASPTFLAGSTHCAHEACSKELCNITGEGQKIELKALTYYIDRQVLLPKGTRLVGAGVGKTIIRACGKPLGRESNCSGVNSCRRGFLLNDDTYIGHFTFIGRDVGRWGDNEVLYGGGAIETPGCGDTYCENPGADPCTGNDCNGINNATVEDLQVEGLSTQNVVYVAMTPPGKAISSNLHFNRLQADGTWADGVNIHGAHKDILVENSVIRYTVDDGFALWSDYDKATNIVFLNNTMEYPRWDAHGDPYPQQLDCIDRPGGYGVNCFAMYGGGRGNKFLNNRCTSTYWGAVVLHGKSDHPGWDFHANFSSDAIITVQGNSVKPGAEQGTHCCTSCPICWWVNENKPTWTPGMLPRPSGDDCAMSKGTVTV